MPIVWLFWGGHADTDGGSADSACCCRLTPQDKVDSYALNNLSMTDTDFDGDEITLEDLWQQTIHVPNVRGGGGSS